MERYMYQPSSPFKLWTFLSKATGPSHITVSILRHIAFVIKYTSRRPYLFSSTLRKEYAEDPDQLQDPLAFEPYKNEQGNDDHDTQGHKVTTGPNEFGHVLEVHAIYARNEGQGQEEGGKYRQQFHDIVASLRIPSQNSSCQ